MTFTEREVAAAASGHEARLWIVEKFAPERLAEPWCLYFAPPKVSDGSMEPMVDEQITSAPMPRIVIEWLLTAGHPRTLGSELERWQTTSKAIEKQIGKIQGAVASIRSLLLGERDDASVLDVMKAINEALDDPNRERRAWAERRAARETANVELVAMASAVEAFASTFGAVAARRRTKGQRFTSDVAVSDTELVQRFIVAASGAPPDEVAAALASIALELEPPCSPASFSSRCEQWRQRLDP